MVWERNADTIVMITNEIENNKLKCHRYWPDESVNNELAYGDIVVKTLEQEAVRTYISRRFSLRRGGKTREVLHFQYVVWPDHGVPQTTAEILDFRYVLLLQLCQCMATCARERTNERVYVRVCVCGRRNL